MAAKPDDRPLTTGALARRLALQLEGDPDLELTGPATLSGAIAGQFSFLANSRYRTQLRRTHASGVILPAEARADCPGAALISDSPYVDWARALSLFEPASAQQPGVHPSAVIDPMARIAPTASIGPLCVLAADCEIGAGAVIGPGCVLEPGVRVGASTRLVARVFVGREVRLGERVLVHPGAVIGADGFGLAMHRGQWRKVPQLGSVIIGDDCEIGANTTIDRGAIEATVLEDDVRLDNQVQIAHNVHIGAHTAIAGCVGVAGSTRIGRYCMIAGASGIGGHLTLCDHVVVTAMSTVLNSIDEPGEYGSGVPARAHRQWQRTLVRLAHLDDLAARLRKLESLIKWKNDS